MNKKVHFYHAIMICQCSDSGREKNKDFINAGEKV